MSKHSLISVGLGLGLMAASMGASAQLHSFDGGMMFFGGITGGSKYTAFVPSLTRGSSAGAAGVLMLELFQPAGSATSSTWAFALGGAVGAAGGGAGQSGSNAFSTINWTASNGLVNSGRFYFGDNDTISHGFTQTVTISSQACAVTFSAVVGTNDQLGFTNVVVKPVGWVDAAAGGLVVTTGSGAATTIDANAWNAIDSVNSVTMKTYAANASFAYNDGDDWVAASASTNAASFNNAVLARNKCVSAYTNRALGGGTTITNQPVGLIRIW